MINEFLRAIYKFLQIGRFIQEKPQNKTLPFFKNCGTSPLPLPWQQTKLKEGKKLLCVQTNTIDILIFFLEFIYAN